VPHQHRIVVAPIQRNAHHVGVGVKARRRVVAGQIQATTGDAGEAVCNVSGYFLDA
jgi:hypothetical protein